MQPAGYVYNKSCKCVRCRTKGLMAPAILITIGIVSLANRGWEFFVPALLIVMGVVQILQANAPTGDHSNPYVLMTTGQQVSAGPSSAEATADQSTSVIPTAEEHHG